ncbi:MAG: hypothetical protein RBT81_04645 [Gammaproteobacteria bacterium]|nr:hypothetical protein [Gammaproteobacteria bacterium]
MKGAVPDAAPFASLALQAVTERLDGGADHCVLDLGPGIGVNIEFCLRIASHVQVADLYDALSTSMLGACSQGSERACCPVFPELLPAPPGRRADLVLAWTLLDYIDQDDLPRLAQHLRAIGAPGLLMHALVSTRTRIPRLPTLFRIEPHGLLALPRTDEECEGPRQGQVRLLERLPGFRVVRSVLLRNGLQEYLFALK